MFGFNLKLEFYGADTDLLFLKKKANLHETILARKLFELLVKSSKRRTRFGHRYVTFAQALIASLALRKLTNA